jgi:hypothetical protein
MAQKANIGRYAGLYLAFTLAIGITNYRSSGSIIRSLSLGAFGGLIATFFLIRLDKKASARLKEQQLLDGDYPARISATAIVHASSEDVIAACVTAIRALPNFAAIRRYNPSKNIVAKTRWSVSSWGEKIAVTAEPTQGGVRLRVTSVPVLWTVIEDVRCNFQNVALILRHVHGVFPLTQVSPEQYFGNVLKTDRQ